jgi:hypothetical protein
LTERCLAKYAHISQKRNLREVTVRCCRIASFLFLCAASLASPLAAEDKPPLTKEQERVKFHPRRVGMDAAARQAGYRKRLEMPIVLLSGMQFTRDAPGVADFIRKSIDSDRLLDCVHRLCGGPD